MDKVQEPVIIQTRDTDKQSTQRNGDARISSGSTGGTQVYNTAATDSLRPPLVSSLV